MSTRPSSLLFALIFSAALVSPVAAQDGADRAFVDSLFQRLGHATSVASVPAPSVCAGRTTQLRLLCEAMLGLRRNDFAVDHNDIASARDLLERLVEERPKWPTAWYVLGVVRLRLVPAGVMSREGPLAPIGVSNETTASNALVRALELDSTLKPAALALAAAPIGREGPTRLGDRLDMLRRRKALLDGPALYQASLVEREAGHRDLAVYYDRDALRRGDVDSGLVELAMARDLYASGNPNEGRMMLVHSAGDTSKAAHTAFRREFEWVATPEELKTLDSLPPAKRPDWVADFWAQRDVRDGRSPGERLIEHYKRMEFAYRLYRMTIPQTGRQKAAGIAQTIDFSASDYADWAMQHSGGAPGNPGTPEAELDNMRTLAMNAGADPGNDRSPFKVFTAPQDLIDDRGVVYVRQGPPDATAHTANGIALELWAYERPDIPLILSFREVNFDGQVGASQLVPTLLAENPQLRDQLCAVKATLCSTVGDPRVATLVTGAHDGTRQAPVPAVNPRMTGRLGLGVAMAANADAVAHEQDRLKSGALMRKEVEDGKEAITTATTTDGYPQHFNAAIEPAVQIYGLDKAAGGEPRVVATFAIQASELASSSPPAAGGRTIYPVRIQLFAANRANGTEFYLDTLRRFATPRALVAGEFLTGYVELPLPAGTYAASLKISQDDGRGVIANLGQVVLPPTRGALMASDLVLGRDSSNVRWNSGSTVVSLNPLNTFRSGETAAVYFQLSGLTNGESYSTRFDFFRANDDAKHPPRLTISSVQPAGQPRMEISKSLGLKNLDPGQYRVRLTVQGKDGGTTTALGWVNIVK